MVNGVYLFVFIYLVSSWWPLKALYSTVLFFTHSQTRSYSVSLSYINHPVIRGSGVQYYAAWDRTAGRLVRWTTRSTSIEPARPSCLGVWTTDCKVVSDLEQSGFSDSHCCRASGISSLWGCSPQLVSVSVWSGPVLCVCETAHLSTKSPTARLFIISLCGTSPLLLLCTFRKNEVLCVCLDSAFLTHCIVLPSIWTHIKI